MTGKGGVGVELVCDIPAVARLMIRLIHDLYGLTTELTVRRSVLHKTPNFLIVVPFQPGIDTALEDLGVFSQGSLEAGIKPELIEEPCCEVAYLRGIFLGGGFVSSPRGDFHFELSIDSDELAHEVAQAMERRGIPARITKRRNATTVYLKSGTAISDFLALVGAHQCALSMENERVIKSVRNDVNRRVNAELANQAKAAQSSVEQVQAIRRVVDAHGIENLPPALQDYIRLRVKHPDATLKELGEYANPPLSKSAIYHRVRRIESMARELDKS